MPVTDNIRRFVIKTLKGVPREDTPKSGASTRGLIEMAPQAKTEGASPEVAYSTLYRIYRNESWARAAVDVIRKSCTSEGYSIVATEDKANPEHEEELKNFFSYPNAEESMTEILDDIFTDLGIYGNAYLEIAKDKIKRPRELWNLDATTIKVKHDEHGKILGYKQTSATGATAEFEPDEVAHFRLTSKGATVYGLSPLESLIQTIDTDLKAQIYMRKYFENFGAPKALFKFKNATPEQVRRNRLYLATQVAGVENAHRNLILEGDVEYEALATALKDTEALKIRRFLRDEIIAVYGVPPAKLTIIESGNIGGGTGESQDKTFKSETIIPLQKKVAAKINHKIIKGLFGILDWEFQFNNVLTVDKLEQAKVHSIYLKEKAMTVDEVREEIGKEPLEIETEGEEEGKGTLPEKKEPKEEEEEKEDEGAPSERKKKVLATKKIDIDFERFESLRESFQKVIKRFVKEKVNEITKKVSRKREGIKVKGYSKDIEGLLAPLDDFDVFVEEVEKALLASLEYGWAEGFADVGKTAPIIPKTLRASVTENALSAATTVVKDLKAGIAMSLIEGVNLGEPIPDLTDRVKTFLTGPLRIPVSPSYDELGNIVRAGYTRTLPIDAWGELIARTETIKMANQGVLASYEESDVDEVRWYANPGACPICEPKQGTIYKLNDAKGLIPVHPNCRCTFLPVIEKKVLPYHLVVTTSYKGQKDIEVIRKVDYMKKAFKPTGPGRWVTLPDGRHIFIGGEEDFEERANKTAGKLREDIKKDGLVKAAKKNKFVNINEVRSSIEEQDPKAIDRFNQALTRVMKVNESGEGSRDYIGGQYLERRTLYILNKTYDTDMIVSRSIPSAGLAYNYTLDYFRRNDLDKAFMKPYIKKSEKGDYIKRAFKPAGPGRWITLPDGRHIFIEEGKGWKPFGTKAEADKWALDSSYKGELYHGTSKANAERIKRKGFDPSKSGGWFLRGAYFTSLAERAKLYRGTGGQVLKVKINTRKLYKVKAGELSLKAFEYVYKEIKAGRMESDVNYIDAFAKYLKKSGHDGVLMHSKDFGGHDEIVMWDKGRIMVYE